MTIVREKEDRNWVWIETGVNPNRQPLTMYRRVAREAEGSRFEGFDLASGFGIGRLEGRRGKNMERGWV